MIGIIHIVDVRFNKIIGDGSSVSFWFDRWWHNCDLFCFYPDLFNITTNPQIIVAEAFVHGTLQLQFNMQLIGIGRDEW